MIRFLFLLLIFTISCNNTLSLNKDGFPRSFFLDEKNGDFYLNYSKKPYVLKDLLIVPKMGKLIIKNGVEIIIKKNGGILNNGTIVFGEKKLDSLNYYKEPFFKKRVFNYNIKITSINSVVFYSEESNSSVFINGGFFKGVVFDYKNTSLIINNSIFKNTSFNILNSVFTINNSYLDNCYLYNNNNSVNFKNCFFNNNKNIKLLNSNNFIINNCLIYNNSSVVINNSYNNNIINNIILNNNTGFILNNNIGYSKFYNNLFINNKTALELKDSSIIYLINNNFDKNQIVLKSELNNVFKKYIISKNNIFSFNKKEFGLNINNILNSYCLSNIDSLIGYYNLYSDPLYINSKNYNYNLHQLSPALRSGNNNNNLGININSIINIKYLK